MRYESSATLSKGSLSQEKKRYFPGFDYLRALFIVFVVGVHSDIAGTLTFADTVYPVRYHTVFSDVLFLSFFCLAVPVFVQISLFLFAVKRTDQPGLWKRRVIYFLKLYLFWFFVHLTCAKVLGWGVSGYFQSLGALFITVISTRSIFYFFFVLVCLIPLTEVYARLTERLSLSHRVVITYTCFILSLIALVFYSRFCEVTYWSPLNFFPYVFSTVIIKQIWEGGSSARPTLILGTVFVLFSVLDWVFIRPFGWNNNHMLVLPEYARVSIVLGAAFFALLSLRIRKTPVRWIKSLSSYSLGIYCLHVYPMVFLHTLFPHSMGLAYPWFQGINFVAGLFCSIGLVRLYRGLKKQLRLHEAAF